MKIQATQDFYFFYFGKPANFAQLGRDEKTFFLLSKPFPLRYLCKIEIVVRLKLDFFSNEILNILHPSIPKQGFVGIRYYLLVYLKRGSSFGSSDP